MKSFENKIKEIEKGCGNVALQRGYNIEYCNGFILCPTCKSNLKLLKEIQKEVNEDFEKVIFSMQQSRDCFGYNPHKVFTTNLIYDYPIEPPKTKEMEMLLDFAMGCYRNGWLEAINQFGEFKKSLGGEK